MDWLVIVGSYLSLSVALVGVKAKQSGGSSCTASIPQQIKSHLPGLDMYGQTNLIKPPALNQQPPLLLNPTNMSSKTCSRLRVCLNLVY